MPEKTLDATDICSKTLAGAVLRASRPRGDICIGCGGACGRAQPSCTCHCGGGLRDLPLPRADGGHHEMSSPRGPTAVGSPRAEGSGRASAPRGSGGTGCRCTAGCAACASSAETEDIAPRRGDCRTSRGCCCGVAQCLTAATTCCCGASCGCFHICVCGCVCGCATPGPTEPGTPEPVAPTGKPMRRAAWPAGNIGTCN
mmetsp:Transcript_45159/g.133689  ORF Transcript_45159/g.133689 Transcript_45159/m.133689 type:complete len:200 (-) Transcript_45159:61-660(-)